MGRIAGRFARVEPRRRARAFVLGLLSGLRRKNCWTIAEQAGDATPDGMQHLLAAARWDADAVRDDLRGYVIDHLGSPDGVLVVDETGDVKKGTVSAGVQRQYSGTAGRVENCQVAVFLSYAAPAGHALIDRELYLPRSWIADPARCAAAGIPAGTAFTTKPGLARAMIGRALDAGTPAAWVTADEVYGADPGLRADLERRQTGYVLAVAASHKVATAAGTCTARELAARLPGRAWQRYSAGAGAKGHRYYDWAWLAIDPGRPDHRHLLIRRNRRTRELAFYRCYSPRRVALPALVKIAGIRWTTEENFQAGKGLAGLDEHQVRRWDSWYRWTTLAMLALAFLTITAATEHADHPAPPDQIPLTRNEIAALFSTLIIEPARDTRHRLRWSTWRRRRQHRAKTCHYQRQARQP
ncbi:MAG TPA: IS701 family transposase [Streptosporangiaceae bacterium]|nr:IS701 family transposase [Streptosporangiaceae bacterium]